MLVQMFSPVWYWFSDRSRDVAMATNFRREIGRNRRHAFLPGTQFHNGWQDGKADGRVNSAEVLSTSCKNLVNFGPLTREFTVMLWRPFIRHMCEIIKTRPILGTRVRQWMAGTAERICAKFTRKTCLVLRADEFECQGQKSKVKVTRDKKGTVHSQPPRYGRNGTPSLQITSRKQQTRRFDRCRGVSSPECVRWAWRAIAGALPRISSFLYSQYMS